MARVSSLETIDSRAAPPLAPVSPQDTTARAESSRPVIFLDIDGVLNRSSSEGDHSADPDLLARFLRVVRDTGARVVMASTWRHDPAAMADARRLGIPFEDVLPDLRPQSRGKEVEAWLAAHPGVTQFVILDDEDDGYAKYPLFQPRPGTGFTSKMADALGAYLAGERARDMRRGLLVRMCQAVWFRVCGHKG
jgi:hypothetical protein